MSDDEAEDNFDDDLECYLDSPVVNFRDKNTTFNVLWWWYDNAECYPRLSRMARDFHSILREWSPLDSCSSCRCSHLLLHCSNIC